MSKIIQEANAIDEQILKKAIEVKELHDKHKILEKESESMLCEFKEVKKKLTMNEINHDELEDRNISLREQGSKLDKNLKVEANNVNAEMKVLKKLGLKITIEPDDDDHDLLKLTIQFKENLKYKVIFVYDPVYEDYDLISLQPEHL